jgi:ATP-dependent helicase HrpA
VDPRLPINQRREEIAAAIRGHQVVVLCGETGSGKTTQLPQICMALGRGSKGLIAHTQPRRLAARSVAARIAEEMGSRLGGVVGVKVRFHEQTSRETRIKLLTDGMMLAELAGDRDLRAYDTIIIDEAHERSLNIDFLMGILRDLLPRRPDLKLIVTSATIDTGRFARYFAPRSAGIVDAEAAAPVIEVSGRTFPVEVRYRPCVDDEEEFDRVEVGAVVDAVDELSSPKLPEGDILVFLPGEREIRLCADALRRASGNDAEILPLFSRLTNAEQDRIFKPASGGRRRVILATNIAETSLTVPGIRYVVDTGLARLNRYDPQKKVQRLPIEPVSRASANQRSGRCGRVAEGVCIRLYSKESFEARPAFTDPEVKRSGLAGVILQMKSLRLGDIEAFPFLEPPDATSIRDGYETLFELGAIDVASREGRLTDIGRKMSRIPADPRVARMLLAAEGEGAVSEVLVLAAALSIQDPRERPMGKADEADRAQLVFRHETSDFVSLLRLWEQYEHAAESMGSGALIGWCRGCFVSAARMREWGETIRQLRMVAEELELPRNSQPASEDSVHRALLTGLISNVACREGAAGSFDYRGARGNVVSIFPGSVLFKKSPQWIMSAEIAQTSRLFARTCARIDPKWIEELAGHVFQRQLSDHHLDAATGEPCAWERVTMSGIVVVPRRKTTLAEADPAKARSLFILEALVRGKWGGDAGGDVPAFVRANRATLASAASAQAKLRRRDVTASDEELASWFETRLGSGVCDPQTLRAWLAADPGREDAVRLSASDVLRPPARAAVDPTRFPDVLRLEAEAGTVEAALEYAMAPGQDHDGVTLVVPLTALPVVHAERAAWLVPGMLADVVLALLKTLPKAQKGAIEAKAALDEAASSCAELMDFGKGPLSPALSESLEGLYGVIVPLDTWAFAGLPAHLRLRVKVVDHHGVELGASRDIAELQERFEGRIRKARAAEARHRFQREGLTDWTFGDLPDDVQTDEGGQSLTMHPALIDHGSSVELTLVESAERAERLTHMGLRRLFALACREEVEAHIDSLQGWGEMCKHHQALGTAAQLKSDLTALIAERAFMPGGGGMGPVRTRAAFEERKQEYWGRLVTSAREVGDVVARMLEPRAVVAQRLNRGTSRHWAASMADIREHAAYLMPRGFLLTVPWDRLRRYPVYALGMRNRLLNLREDGSGAETQLLAKFGPQWKRFTGWVARAMSAERAKFEALALETERSASPGSAARGTPGKAPLPQARRAAPRVNLEAGEWAMEPGNLPVPVWAFRWALEEARVAMFAPETPGVQGSVVGELDALWAKCEPTKK